MRFKKNVNVDLTEEDMTIEQNDSSDPLELALWYNQFLKLDGKKKKQIVESCLKKIKEIKPETFNFIKKFKCELVGLCPRIEYTLPNNDEGNSDVTWVHSFSMPTLLFWCDEGGFSFFVNPNLNYNDTVLNKVNGNRKQSLKGFTA